MPAQQMFLIKGGAGSDELAVIGNDFQIHRVVESSPYDYQQKPIDVELESHRLNQGGIETLKLTEAQFTYDNGDPQITLDVGENDQYTQKSVTFESESTYGGDELDDLTIPAERERSIRRRLRRTGERVNVKMSNTDTKEKFHFRDFVLKYFGVGSRRRGKY